MKKKVEYCSLITYRFHYSCDLQHLFYGGILLWANWRAIHIYKGLLTSPNCGRKQTGSASLILAVVSISWRCLMKSAVLLRTPRHSSNPPLPSLNPQPRIISQCGCNIIISIQQQRLINSRNNKDYQVSNTKQHEQQK